MASVSDTPDAGSAKSTGKGLRASIGAFLDEINERHSNMAAFGPEPPATLTLLGRVTQSAAGAAAAAVAPSANWDLRAQLAAAEEKIRALRLALDDETRRHHETRSALKAILAKTGILDPTTQGRQAIAAPAAGDATARPLHFASSASDGLLSPPAQGAPPPLWGDADSPVCGRKSLVDQRHLQQLLGTVEVRLFNQSPVRSLQPRGTGAGQHPLLSPAVAGGTTSSASGKSPSRRATSPAAGYPPRHVGFGNGAPRFREFVQAGDQTVFASSSLCSVLHHRDTLQFSPVPAGKPAGERSPPREGGQWGLLGGSSVKAAQLRKFLRAASPPARSTPTHANISSIAVANHNEPTILFSPMQDSQQRYGSTVSPWLA